MKEYVHTPFFWIQIDEEIGPSGTGLAIAFEIDARNVWIPLSVIANKHIDEKTGKTTKLYLPEWFIKQKKLEAYID